jgi:hypothetical protein
MGCSGLQNDCELPYHTADSVLTSGCSFIRQHIWITLCIVLAILGRCIKGQWSSAGKTCMWIRITGRQLDYFEMLSSGSVTRWGRWSSGQRWIRLWSWFWSLLAVSVGQKCTCTIALPLGMRIVGGCICHGRNPGVWFGQSISRCLSIAAFTSIFPADTTPCFLSSRTAVWGFLIRCCVSSMTAENSLLWPFWPRSWWGAFRTIVSLHDHIALQS